MTDKPSDDLLLAEPVPEPAAAEAAAEEVPPAPQAPLAPAPVARRSGWGGPVLGGVIAAVIGYGLGQYMPLFSGATAGVSGPSVAELAAVRAEIADLKAAIAPADLDGLTARLEALEGTVAETRNPDLAAIEGRIAALEARPVGSLSGADAAALAGLQAEVAAMRSGGISQAQVAAANTALQEKLDETLAAAAAMQEDAAETATKSAERAALLQIGAALDSGAPFGSALKALEGAALPEVLLSNAKGLPSLKSLQDTFPAAARLALDAALKDQMGSTWTERATAFLRTQVGARSLRPRDGDDPDAILSRAEAALSAGDVGSVLGEVDKLPEVARTALAGWRVGADLHQQARTALATLMQERGL